MFDDYLDSVFTGFDIQECLDAINDETTALAGWNQYVELVGGDAPESDYWNEGTSVHAQWDYKQLSQHCETLMRVMMENLSLDELLKALECGEQVLDYADEDTKNVYQAWQLQSKLIATLSEKKESRSVKI
jgi:hypothetical protein